MRTLIENLIVPPATAQLSLAVGLMMPLCRKVKVVTSSVEPPTSVVLKSMPSAGTPKRLVRWGVVLIEKSTLAKVCRLCFSALLPVLAMMLPAASSS